MQTIQILLQVRPNIVFTYRLLQLSPPPHKMYFHQIAIPAWRSLINQQSRHTRSELGGVIAHHIIVSV